MSSLPTTLDDLMSACLEAGAYCVKGAGSVRYPGRSYGNIGKQSACCWI